MLLGLSERTISRVARKVRVKGVAGIKHVNSKNIPHYQIDQQAYSQIIELLKKKYHGFNLIHAYVDNGSEFINSTVVDKYVAKHLRKIKIYRSRAYHKNDQCYVEQKNYTHVRHLFGYGRIDWKSMTRLMNTTYRKQWSILQNYFIPQQKLIKKN